MNIQRTFTTVFCLAWVAGIGFWLASGHHDWRVAGAAMLANLPLVMTSYYFGHRHGYDARQAEVQAVLQTIPPRSRSV